MKFSSIEITDFHDVLKSVLDSLSITMEKEHDNFENLMRQNEMKGALKSDFNKKVVRGLKGAGYALLT